MIEEVSEWYEITGSLRSQRMLRTARSVHRAPTPPPPPPPPPPLLLAFLFVCEAPRRSWEVAWGQFDLCQMDLPRGSEKLRNRLTISHSKLIDFAIKLLSNYCILLSDQYRSILEVFQARQVSVCHILSEHFDRQTSSESAFERVGKAFGTTGVERERISTLRKRIWIDKRRARAYFNTPDVRLG